MSNCTRACFERIIQQEIEFEFTMKINEYELNAIAKIELIVVDTQNMRSNQIKNSS